MAGVAQKLISYAKQRETAYRAAGCFSGQRAAAISRIRKVAEFFSSKTSAQQVLAVRQLEQEILQIIPAEGSRFGKLRSQVLELIDTSKSIAQR